MKFVSGILPFDGVSPGAAKFGHQLDVALARQAQGLVEHALALGADEDEAVALIVWALLKSAITYVGFETLEQDRPFPQAEFERLTREIVDVIGANSGSHRRAQS